MTDELAPQVRKRINLGRSVKGVITWDFTIEHIGADVPTQPLLEEVYDLEAILQSKYPSVEA